MWKNCTIFQKIFSGIILLVFFTLFLCYSFAFFYEYRLNTEKFVQESISLSDKINDALADYIVQVDGTISSIYYELYQNETGALSTLLRERRETGIQEMIQQRESLNKYFSQLFLMRRDFIDVYIYVDDSKSYIYSTYGGRALDYTPSSEQWYQDTLKKEGKTNITINYIPGQITYRKPVVGFSRVLKNVNGEGILDNTVIKLDFAMKNLDSLMNTYITNDSTTVLLVDNMGRVVYENGAPICFQEGTAVDLPAGKEKSYIRKIGGDKYLLACDGQQVYKWKVIIAANTDYIMQQTRGYLIFAVSIGAFLILLAAGLSYFFAKTICRPIKVLESGMEKIQEGNFDIYLSKESDDELGKLIDVFNRMAMETKRLIKERYEEELQKKEAQYKFLQAQIDPHFIFNALQIISSMAVVNKTPEIGTMSNSLARLIRYSIHGNRKTISLKEEIKNVKSYLDIQKIRFRDRLDFEINVPPELNHIEIIKLILQPIVENGIQHGLEPDRGSGKISILGYRAGKEVYIEIIDNGKGMKEAELNELQYRINQPSDEGSRKDTEEKQNLEAMEKGNHVGLRNINLRLKMFYGESYGLVITSCLDKGTKVTICIPEEF